MILSEAVYTIGLEDMIAAYHRRVLEADQRKREQRLARRRAQRALGK